MVRKDFNHPSVIMYSIGNEIPEAGTPLGAVVGPRRSPRRSGRSTTPGSSPTRSTRMLAVIGEILGDSGTRPQARESTRASTT